MHKYNCYFSRFYFYCPHCFSHSLYRYGKDKYGREKYICRKFVYLYFYVKLTKLFLQYVIFTKIYNIFKIIYLFIPTIVFYYNIHMWKFAVPCGQKNTAKNLSLRDSLPAAGRVSGILLFRAVRSRPEGFSIGKPIFSYVNATRSFL